LRWCFQSWNVEELLGLSCCATWRFSDHALKPSPPPPTLLIGRSMRGQERSGRGLLELRPQLELCAEERRENLLVVELEKLCAEGRHL
jgi:hypothetical protein